MIGLAVLAILKPGRDDAPLLDERVLEIGEKPVLVRRKREKTRDRHKDDQYVKNE